MMIRKQEREGLVDLPDALHVWLKKGQKVRITGGSFEGQIGLYEGMSGKDWARVLFVFLFPLLFWCERMYCIHRRIRSRSRCLILFFSGSRLFFLFFFFFFFFFFFKLSPR